MTFGSLKEPSRSEAAGSPVEPGEANRPGGASERSGASFWSYTLPCFRHR